MTTQEELIYLSGNILCGLLSTNPTPALGGQDFLKMQRMLVKIAVNMAVEVVIAVHGSIVDLNSDKGKPPD